MSREITPRSILISACLLHLSTACSGYSVTGGPKPLVQEALTAEAAESFLPLTVNVVAVLPLEAGVAFREPPNLLRRLDARLITAFDLRTSLEVLNKSQAEKMRNVLVEPIREQLPLFARATRFGQQIGAQGVICGVVNRYRDSAGTKYGADELASVQFKLWLLDVGLGRVVWTATYEKSDEPLSSNLFRLREKLTDGLEFSNAVELVNAGFLAAATELEQLRQEELAK